MCVRVYVLLVSLAQAGRPLPPRLVAVSKGRPVGLVEEAYGCGVRHFGENYVSWVSRAHCIQRNTPSGMYIQVQELQSKAGELKVDDGCTHCCSCLWGFGYRRV